MASFVYTWNASFESLPPDQGENASLGASRIRALKIAVRERFEIDHSLAGDGDDGKHKKVTLINQTEDPTLETGDYALFVKNGQLVFMSQGSSGVGFGFPSGTAMLFRNSTAPTGWTKSTVHNNKSLRVVSGNISQGGTRTFTSTFASSRATSSSAPGTSSAGNHNHGGNTSYHTLTISQIPSHAHTYVRNQSSIGVSGGGGTALWLTQSASTSSAGGGGAHRHGIGNSGNHSHTVNSHAHSLAMDVAYVDVIIATKD